MTPYQKYETSAKGMNRSRLPSGPGFANQAGDRSGAGRQTRFLDGVIFTLITSQRVDKILEAWRCPTVKTEDRSRLFYISR
jgi:hypothetical protein